MTIPFRLRALLEQRGLKQCRVAELAGIPNETMSRIVTGSTKNPGVDTLSKIANALGVTVGALLGENEKFAPMVFDEESVEWSLVGIVIGWSHDAR